jgi:hypothetical protein
MRRAALPLALALVLAGCGASETSGPGATETQPPPETAPTVQEEMTSIVVYFTRGEQVAPVHREVPQTSAVGTAAMVALLDGPTAAERELDIASNVPEGARLIGLEVAGGTATVNLSREFESGGGTLSMTARLAELVFTLTQFSTVERVQLELDGAPVSVFGGEGILIEEPMTRESFPDVTPIILVERPALLERVSSPVRVSGSASVFEATLHVPRHLLGGAAVQRERRGGRRGVHALGRRRLRAAWSGSPGRASALIGRAPRATTAGPARRSRLRAAAAPRRR